MFNWQKGNHCEEFESLESKLLNIELDLQDYGENLDLNNFDGNIYEAKKHIELVYKKLEELNLLFNEFDSWVKQYKNTNKNKIGVNQ